MYDRLVVSPGQALRLGSEGGVLVLAPPGSPAGLMSLTDMQNKIWLLLREPGPDTGSLAPVVGDFAIGPVTRDLNIAIAQFISQTGLSPMISEKFATLPVFVTQFGDYPLPADLVALTKVEYTPYGQQTYTLAAYSMLEFDNRTGGVLPNATGQPWGYRAPYAGYIRLQPMPSAGNASGPPAGDLSLAGVPVAGQIVTAAFVYNGLTTLVPYTVLLGDTLQTIALALSQKINAAQAVQGAGAFLQPCAVDGTTTGIAFRANSQTLAAYAITYYGTVTGIGLTIAPGAPTQVQPTGDTMNMYYTSMGTVLVNPGDTPGIPPQFHMALVYRVLMDYWRVKQDIGQAKEYERMFKDAVKEAKGLVFDAQRSSQFTIGGSDDTADVPLHW